MADNGQRDANGRWLPGHAAPPGAGRPRTLVTEIGVKTKESLLAYLLEDAPRAAGIIKAQLGKGNVMPYLILLRTIMPKEVDLSADLSVNLHAAICQVASPDALEEARRDLREAVRRYKDDKRSDG